MELFKTLDSALNNQEFCDYLDNLDLTNCYERLYGAKTREELYFALIESNIDPFTNVTALSLDMFSHCDGLTKVELPPSIDCIGVGAFSYCSNLDEIILSPNLKLIGSSAFEGSGIFRIDIPEGVKVIPPYCFYDCKFLETIILPQSTWTMFSEAFEMLPSLKTIYFRGTKVQWEQMLANSQDSELNSLTPLVQFEYKGN